MIAEVDAVWVEKGDLSAFTMPFLSKVVEQMLYKQPTNNLTLFCMLAMEITGGNVKNPDGKCRSIDL